MGIDHSVEMTVMGIDHSVEMTVMGIDHSVEMTVVDLHRSFHQYVRLHRYPRRRHITHDYQFPASDCLTSDS
jgi:hypothetical protein